MVLILMINVDLHTHIKFNQQLNLFNSLENTTDLECQSLENTKSGVIGQTHTNNPKSIYNRERVRQRKRDLIKYKGGICERCDGEYHPNLFDFHHHDASQKSFSVGQKEMTRKWKVLIAEVEKCHLLCSNCHRKVHTEQDKHFMKL